MYYSAVDYWTPTWNYPRGRLREPFPRREKRGLVWLFPPSGAIAQVAAHGLTAGAGPRFAFSGSGAAPRFVLSDSGASGGR